jgi:hypothetical protein
MPAKKTARGGRRTAAARKPKATSSKASRGKTGTSKSRQRWSARVMKTSDALDIQPRAFTYDDPKKIARSLKRSAERSHRRKTGPYQSAMSMLNFYINRGGKNLPATRKRILERAKVELRHAFGRD